MEKRGLLLVVSGFSGVGKGTLVKGLLNQHKDYVVSVSVTTRGPREGEVDGESYFFISNDRFEEMIAKDELIEYARYVDNYYGTPRTYVEEQLEAGKNVILEIEIQGALKVRKKFPDAVLVFVVPPSVKELRERLLRRGTEDESTITKRLRWAVEESEGIELYDYIVINDDLQEGIDQLHHIVETEKCHTKRRLSFITQLQNELKEMWKA